MWPKSIHYKRIGALSWIVNVQYYIVQLVVALAWPASRGYSWAHNTISDLGNLHDSPLYWLMNLSFMVLGLTIVLGAAGLRRPGNRLGLGCLAVSAIGTILVGIFPENSIAGMHVLGASLAFIVGNAGVLLLGLEARSMPKVLRVLTVLAGMLGLVGLALFFTKQYLGLGEGGMERVAGYPQSIWMIAVGVYLLFGRINKAVPGALGSLQRRENSN